MGRNPKGNLTFQQKQALDIVLAMGRFLPNTLSVYTKHVKVVASIKENFGGNYYHKRNGYQWELRSRKKLKTICALVRLVYGEEYDYLLSQLWLL